MPSAAKHDRNHATALDAYLLGRVDFGDWLDWQRRLVDDVRENPTRAAVVLCEHPHGISIGRGGSLCQLGFDVETAVAWPIRWVHRGGGCLLAAPGQVVMYPIIALDALGLNVQEYIDRLSMVLTRVIASFGVEPTTSADSSSVLVGGRRIADLGVAIRDGVTSFGCSLNVDPELRPFRRMFRTESIPPLTSLERERRVRLRPAAVRQRLLAEFIDRFQFERVAIVHRLPISPGEVSLHAAATRVA